MSSSQLTEVKFADRDATRIISKIVDRAYATLDAATVSRLWDGERISMMMDLSACHANGCPLRLEELLNADGLHFTHDVCGIAANIDRETGRLGNFFVPRFAQ